METELPYFPRSPFDQVCLGHIGNLNGVAIFAPRRRGKTALVRHELIPGGQNRGYDTIYIDLWRNEATPELAIVEGLEKAVPQKKWKISKIKGSGKAKSPIGDIGGELELTPSAASQTSLVARLNNALDRLRATRKNWIVFMDEFQALATSKEEGFVAALRTGIQAEPRNIKLFVTGSSRRQLAKMLTKQKSPFLGMLMQLDLPELDEAFVRNRCDLIFERTKRKISRSDLMTVFERVVLVPEYLNQIVSIMIVEGVYLPDEAYQKWRTRHTEGEASTTWETLSQLERLLLQIVHHQPSTPLFAEDTISWLNKQLGEATTKAKVQAALRRLERGSLVEPGTENGEYEVADDGMRLYLVYQETPHLPPLKGAEKAKK